MKDSTWSIEVGHSWFKLNKHLILCGSKHIYLEHESETVSFQVLKGYHLGERSPIEVVYPTPWYHS